MAVVLVPGATKAYLPMASHYARNVGLTAFTVGGTGIRVYYAGEEDGNVYEIANYRQSWHNLDVSLAVQAINPRGFTSAGFPYASNALPRVYSDDWQSNGHVHENAYYGGSWHYGDLTVAAGAGQKRAGGLVAFPVTSIGIRVYYLDNGIADGRVNELAYY